MNLGKILRLHKDGSIPADNPFVADGGVTAQIWTLGHRNPLGIAFDAAGRLWSHEMGPRGIKLLAFSGRNEQITIGGKCKPMAEMTPASHLRHLPPDHRKPGPCDPESAYPGRRVDFPITYA